MPRMLATTLLALAFLLSTSAARVCAAESALTLLASIDDPPDIHIPSSIDIRSAEFRHDSGNGRLVIDTHFYGDVELLRSFLPDARPVEFFRVFIDTDAPLISTTDFGDITSIYRIQVDAARGFFSNDPVSVEVDGSRLRLSMPLPVSQDPNGRIAVFLDAFNYWTPGSTQFDLSRPVQLDVLNRQFIDHTAPLYSSTVYLTPGLITEDDHSTFLALAYAGQSAQIVFDHRVGDWHSKVTFNFTATFEDGVSVLVRVNPEFGSVAAAQEPAEFYARILGRIPRVLFANLRTLTIHKGSEAAGGSGANGDINLHTESSAIAYQDGYMEEVMLHEAVHVSMDYRYLDDPAWLAAQSADGAFLSDYGKLYPSTEDMAESFMAYAMVYGKADKLPQSLLDSFASAIPARLAYFDSLAPDLYPFARTTQRMQQPLTAIITHGGAATSTSMTAGAFRMGESMAETTFEAGTTIEIVGTINPEASDVGRPANVYVVLRSTIDGQDSWSYRNEDGLFVPWNVVVGSLEPAARVPSIGNGARIRIYSGTLQKATHRLFLGYRRDGDTQGLRYNTVGMRFDVTD